VLDVTQVDEAARQQPQGPAGEAGRRLAAGQSDQLDLLFAVEFALVLSGGFAWAKGAIQALFDEGLADAVDGSQADVESLTNLCVRVARVVLGSRRFEQDAGTGDGPR
jgi:hypothetical protein